MYKESMEVIIDTVFERGKIFYSPVPSEIEEGVSVIHPI